MGMKPRKKRDRVWHFCGDRDGIPVLRDGTPLHVGEWLEVEGYLRICYRGLHGSRRAIDALTYAPGPWVSLCEVEGIVDEHDDKLVARRRRHLWCYDATDVLRAWGRRCALDVIDLWEAPDVVRRYLETGDESLRGATQATTQDAWAATWAARAAAQDARAAARDAALADAWDAARDRYNRDLETAFTSGRGIV